MRFRLKGILISPLLLALSCLSVVGQGQKPPQEIPTVTFCDLIKKASLYDGKVVRLEANYYVQFEFSYISDSSCGQTAWVDFASDIDSSTPPKLLKQLKDWMGEGIVFKRNCRIYARRRILVNWVGLFEVAKPLLETAEQTIVPKFGHMGQFDFQFTVKAVEEVNKREASDVRSCPSHLNY